ETRGRNGPRRRERFAPSALLCRLLDARSGGERAESVEDEEPARIEKNVHRLPDGEIVHAVRKHHPTLAGEIDVDEALRSGDLGDRHARADRNRVRTGSGEVHVVWAEPDRVAAIGKAGEDAGGR